MAHLCADPKIQKAIKTLLTKKFGVAEVNIARVLDEMAALAFYDPKDAFDEDGNLLPIHKMPEAVRRAVQSFDFREEDHYSEDGSTYKTTKIRNVKLLPKKHAIEMFGKFYAMFTDKKVVEGGDKPLQIKHSLDERDVNERINKMLGAESPPDKVQLVDDNEQVNALPAESITRDTFEVDEELGALFQ